MKDEQSEITNNIDEVIKVAEEICIKLYSCNYKQKEDPDIEALTIEVSYSAYNK